ncbi:MAG: ComEC/Rec2 family competence protein [Treponema sp.]|jgi:competence protein ComEC|nr:ComEC/Rec2 family competence protein [Treponema sp.]
MLEIVPVPPPLYGAWGAAISYYGLGFLSEQDKVPWIAGVLLFMAMLWSLMQVLAHNPALFGMSLRTYQRVYRYRVYSLALILGMSLGLTAGSRIQPVWFGIPEDQVQGVYGTLQEDPRAFHDHRGMGYLALKQVSGPGGIKASSRGTLRVFFPQGTIPRLQTFGRGSEVYLEGAILTLEPRTQASPNREKCFRAQSVHLLGPAPALEQLRTRGRMKLMEGFAGEPWAGLAEALLLGVKDNLDTALSQAYQYAGCSHILALSGMHLAMLTGALAWFLRNVLGIKAAALLGGSCIMVYVYMAGNFPSLHRAGIMYLLGTLAVLGSFPKPKASSRGISLLGMAFLIQIMVRPESGRSVSFILSYLALGGILFIGKAIHERIRGMIPEILAQPLAASLGAFIAAAPGAAWFFGSLRPMGILAGLIIVPLTAVFMLGALSARILPGNYLGVILTILYDVLTRLVSLAAQVPGIPLSDPLAAAALSLGVSGILMFLRYRQTLKRRNLAPFD